MDNLQYEQYSFVIKKGTLSLDGLKRIVLHDKASDWSNTPGGKARLTVLKDIEEGKIIAKKLLDEKTDALYGIKWPLPLDFENPKDININSRQIEYINTNWAACCIF